MTDLVQRRIAGLAGIVGALMFFVGDMIFYGEWGSGAGFAARLPDLIKARSADQIAFGGLLGPLAGWLCCIGFWHVRQNLRRPHGAIGALVFAVATLSMISLGAVHLLWAVKGFAIQACTAGEADCARLSLLLKSYWNTAWAIAAAPGYLLALLLAALVIGGRTNYPRWTTLANPAVLAGALLVLPPAPAPFGAALAGGDANLALALFFIVSVVSTWHVARVSEAPAQSPPR